MMLGKRQRNPLKRTTSMSEIIFDLNTTTTNSSEVIVGEVGPSDHHHNHVNQPMMINGSEYQVQGYAAAGGPRTVLQSRSNRRASVDFAETAHFLRTCSLCKRRLVPGRDIYMYRGDGAFCSLECRQQQINQDERKDKSCSLTATKKESSTASAGPTVTTPRVSANGHETTVAAL